MQTIIGHIYILLSEECILMINYNSTVFSFLHLLQIILIDIFYWHTLYSKCIGSSFTSNSSSP